MILILIFASLIFLLYLFLSKHSNYWKERNVPFVKPMLIFGNFYEVLTMKKGLGFFLADLYNEMIDHPFFGIWVFQKPYLIVKSPDLVKSILVSDFDVFSDRTVFSDENADPYIANMLFFQKNSSWKRARKLMTPAFTSGKLKAMMPLIDDCTKDMVDFIRRKMEITDVIESKYLSAKYMLAITGSCIFGIDVKVFEDGYNKFDELSTEALKGDLNNAIRTTSYFFIHSLVQCFKLSFIKPHIREYFSEIFTETITHREKEEIKRNDFVEILLHYKIEEKKNGHGNADVKAIGQAIMFYLASYDTTSTTISFTLYEMCINRSYQNKLRDDILSNIQKYGGVTYEAIMDMKYLDNCLSETLRKYPVLPFLDRLCNKDYKLPGTDILIAKGTPIFIPTFGLHNDPNYFPNPEKYDPDRFTEENSKKRQSFCYLPFGEGPHGCIGARFGLLAAKLCLINIFSNFKIHKNKDTPIPVILDPKSLFLQSTVGLSLTFTKYKASN